MNNPAITGPDALEFVADLAGKAAEAIGRDLGVLCQRELTWTPSAPEAIEADGAAPLTGGPALVVPGRLTGELAWQGLFAIDERLAALLAALMVMTPDDELASAAAAGLDGDAMDAFGEIANQLFASFAAACREFFEAEISPEGQPPARSHDGRIDPALLNGPAIAVRFAVDVPGQEGGVAVWAMPRESAEAFRRFVVETVRTTPGDGPSTGDPANAPAAPVASAAVPPAPAYSDQALKRILKIRVPLSVVVAEKPMTMESVLNLSPGIIVEFEKDGDAPLDLRVYDRHIGTGEAVKLGEKFGLRLLKVESVRETIKKLGGQ